MMTEDACFVIGDERVPVLTSCAGRKLEWQAGPLGLSCSVDGLHTAITSPGSWALTQTTEEPGPERFWEGAESTMLDAQRRVLGVLAALLGPPGLMTQLRADLAATRARAEKAEAECSELRQALAAAAATIEGLTTGLQAKTNAVGANWNTHDGRETFRRLASGSGEMGLARLDAPTMRSAALSYLDAAQAAEEQCEIQRAMALPIKCPRGLTC